jgi:hypothetical protein
MKLTRRQADVIVTAVFPAEQGFTVEELLMLDAASPIEKAAGPYRDACAAGKADFEKVGAEKVDVDVPEAALAFVRDRWCRARGWKGDPESRREILAIHALLAG